MLFNRLNIDAQYNYGLLLQQNGRAAEAEKIYLNALKLEPSSGNAITILYMQQKQFEKCLATERLLQQYHGTEPEYELLFKQLRLQ